jgi:hypothetical protein
LLSFVKEALIGAGLVAPQSRLNFNVVVSTGDALSMEVGDPGHGWYHVKVSRYGDLLEQFERYCLARARFQTRTAEPLAHVRLGGWSILMARSTDHRGVCAVDLSGAPEASRLGRDLIDFFAVAKEHATADSNGQSHEAFMSKVTRYLSASPDISPKVMAALATIDTSLLADVPHISQHGDFVLNNLGCANGRLLVFDWEDYDATRLAGFDIFMMSLSVTGMNESSARMIQQTEDPSGHPWAFAQEACAASRLAYAAFRAAVPIYLLTFRYLKRNYGMEIGRRIDDILSRILPDA